MINGEDILERGVFMVRGAKKGRVKKMVRQQWELDEYRGDEVGAKKRAAELDKMGCIQCNPLEVKPVRLHIEGRDVWGVKKRSSPNWSYGKYS